MASADASSEHPSRDVTTKTPPTHNGLVRTGIKAVAIVLGARIGWALLRRGARLVFGGHTKRSPAPRRQSLEPSRASAVPVVPASAHWQPLDVPPPIIPADFKPLASLTLPCSVYTFYTHVIAQQSDFLQQQHEQVDRIYDYTKRAWWPTPMNLNDYPESDDQSMLQSLGRTVFDLVLGAGSSGGYTRTVTFTTPPKPPNTHDARCVQRQQFAVYQNNTLVMATAMNMLNIPFKDCFMVLTAWRAEPGPQPGTCRLTIAGKVHFVKNTIMAGIIRSTTFRDLRSFYTAMGTNMMSMLASASQAPEPPPGAAAAWRAQQAKLAQRRGSTAGAAGSSNAGSSLMAHTVSKSRQFRVLVVMFVLLGSVLHQLFMHRELQALAEQLSSRLQR